jgi:small subunit ribosomal protein S16
VSVKLRLMRVGKKKQPTYRVVAADSRSPRDGRFIEIVGTYAPRSEPSEINLKSDKALAWLAKGAQPTETVRKLLEISGVWGEFQAGKPAKEKPARTRKTTAKATKATKTTKAAKSTKATKTTKAAQPAETED